MTDAIKRRLRVQLASEIEFKIRLLERRAAIHAQTIYPIKDLELKSPDYGLGIIPKLIVISNSNEESEKAIDECNRNKKKLLLIRSFLNIVELQGIVKCLANNEYARMTMDEIKCLLKVNSGKKKYERNLVLKGQYESTFTFTRTLDMPFRPYKST